MDSEMEGEWDKMPYIRPEAREVLEKYLHQLIMHTPLIREPDWAGTLNYVITSLVVRSDPTSYADFASAVGVLETCKLELYRRMIAPYEDEKIEQNGDVY